MPTLNVLLVCGNNLVAKDSNGKSDPYVYLTVGGTTRKSSTKINTLNPTYNEHFTFPVHNPAVDTLKIQVYDYDIIGANDPMGSCVVSLATLVRGRPTRQTHTLGGVRHGNITLELTAVDFGAAFPPTPHAHAPHQAYPPQPHQAYPQAYPPQPHQAYPPPQPSHQAYPPPQAYPPQQPYPPPQQQPSYQAYPPQPAYGAPPQPAYGAPPVYGGAPPPSSGYPVSSAPAYGYPGPQPAYGHHTVVMAGHGGKHKHKHKKHKKHKGFKAKKFFKKGFKKGFF